MPSQLAGNVKHGGLFETAFGITLGELVEQIGGGTAESGVRGRGGVTGNECSVWQRVGGRTCDRSGEFGLAAGAATAHRATEDTFQGYCASPPTFGL